MHLLSEKICLQGLKDLGLLSGHVDKMAENRMGFIFQPCGLGHLIGLDVHDVGGYLNHNSGPKFATPERDMRPGLKNLRTTRELKAGMCITIEPGIYFRDFLLNGELESTIDLSCLNLEKIKEYQKEVGGIRVEDVVLITQDGCELLSDELPRTVEEIEKFMENGESWN